MNQKVAKRCTTYFDMRSEVTAKYAQDHGFDLISSTLGILDFNWCK